MIPFPNLSPNLTLKDIRELRNYDSKMMENMTSEERITYINDGAKSVIKEIEERKAKLHKKSKKAS